MKDFLLIPIMLAVMALGFVVMAKIDSFIEENRRLLHAENSQNRMHIHIGAESPMLLDSVAAQLAALRIYVLFGVIVSIRPVEKRRFL